MARKLRNFIDGFVRYMANKGSPSIYTKWAGIFLVGAVCERKVWLRTVKGPLYPNQYVILVGPAGIGKSVCTSTVTALIDDIRGPDTIIHLAPSSVTKASLIDALDGAERRIIRPMQMPSVVSFNSLIIVPNEFGVFMPSWEGDFMNTMTDLWDGNRYAETRRTKSISIEIPRPQLNMLSATTPAYLNSLLPEGAWELGFMSRTLLVYSGEIIYTDLFVEEKNDEELWKDLKADLLNIYKRYGELTVTDEAKEAINAWARTAADAPDHPKLLSYCTRRVAHLLKLCIIAAVSSGDEDYITLEHFAEALDWLTELEKFMPDIFKSMKSGGDARAMEECWHFAYQWWLKKKEPVPEHLIYTFLAERIPAHSVDRMLDVMVKSSVLTKKFTASGGTGYEPKARRG